MFRGIHLATSQPRPFQQIKYNDQNSFSEGLIQTRQVNSAEILNNEKGYPKLRGSHKIRILMSNVCSFHHSHKQHAKRKSIAPFNILIMSLLSLTPQYIPLSWTHSNKHIYKKATPSWQFCKQRKVLLTKLTRWEIIFFCLTSPWSSWKHVSSYNRIEIKKAVIFFNMSYSLNELILHKRTNELHRTLSD